MLKSRKRIIILLFLSLMTLCIYLFRAYRKSHENHFYTFLVSLFHTSPQHHFTVFSDDKNIDTNAIKIQQIRPKQNAIIVYENGSQSTQPIHEKNKYTFFVLYKNKRLGSFMNYTGKKPYSFEYQLTFFRDKKAQVLFTYSIKRKS